MIEKIDIVNSVTSYVCTRASVFNSPTSLINFPIFFATRTLSNNREIKESRTFSGDLICAPKPATGV